MKKLMTALACASLLSLAACAANQGQNVYNAEEVGKQSDVEFGVIRAVKQVKVQKQQGTGIGAVGGATAGGLAGSQVGNGSGSVAGAVAGVLVGAIAGEMAERKLAEQVGIQYTIKKENGKTVTIVQNINKDDEPLVKGQKVMIQTSGEYQNASGTRGGRESQYQRVLPVD